VSISREDLDIIEQHLDDRYVMQTDCNDKQEKFNKKLANDDKRIELIQHDFNVIKKLVTIVATASIGSLVTAIFELIIR
jgi:hypothetical protein